MLAMISLYTYQSYRNFCDQEACLEVAETEAETGTPTVN